MKISHLGAGVMLFEDAVNLNNAVVRDYIALLERNALEEQYTKVGSRNLNSGGYDHGDLVDTSPVRFFDVAFAGIANQHYEMLVSFEQTLYLCAVQYARRFSSVMECIRWKTRGYIIRYSSGQMIGPHNDCMLPYAEDGVTVSNMSPIANTLTSGIFLNDDFDGGDVRFRSFGISIKPRPGSILIYPSNFIGCHEVEEIKSGTRYAYLSWFKHGDIHGRPVPTDKQHNFLESDSTWLGNFQQDVRYCIQDAVPVGELEVI